MTDAFERLMTALADRYTIERELGRGGMATVYLAEDLKHHRKVAVKVLRPELAAVLGGERFVQEITTTANLQHPHILPLFDSGEADGFLYYVMPYVEGESLRDKLDREKQFSIEQSIEITKAVASALDYAHRQNVIHRDIKPENILLHDGQPVVADFGIALAVSAAAGNRMTETGLSLGTPHYMSPEQATAEKDITNRSDIYSLGAVLYEMLTGDPPHVGSSAQQIIMKIVTDEARSVTELRKSVPPNVAAAVSKALEKLPADRFESAERFATALTNPAFALPTPLGAQAATKGGRWSKQSTTLAFSIAALFAAVALWGWLRPESRRTAPYDIAFVPGQEVSGEQLAHSYFDISPDGSWIVYVGPGERGGKLWVKSQNEYAATPLSGTDGARGPSISPDGQWIAFTADGTLQKVPLSGGASVMLAELPTTASQRRAAWLDDGTLVYIGRDWRLHRVPATGGPSEQVLLEPDQAVRGVSPLPDSRGVLVIAGETPSEQELWSVDLHNNTAQMVLSDVQWAHYASNGYLIAGNVGQVTGIFAAPFSLETLDTTGAAVTLFEDAVYAVLSRNGTLLTEFIRGGYYEAVWTNRDGAHSSVDPTWRFQLDAFSNYGWALSPDDTKLTIGLANQGLRDIWIKELDGGPVSRLTFGGDYVIRPRWMPDGQSVVYVKVAGPGGEAGVYTTRADGTGLEELVFAIEFGQEVVVAENGEWIVVRIGTGDGTRDIIGFRPGLDSVPVPLLSEEHDEMSPTLSADSRWLAYTSTESGRPEVYVRPFPDIQSGKWQISTGGGIAPLWSHDGREIFYVTPDRQMVAATVETVPTIDVRERRVLFVLTPDFVMDQYHTAHDITRDDQRFVMVRKVEEDIRQLRVFEDVFEILKQRVGNGND